eukprot:GAHX01002207.1.p2 GENE.GAHX01002207.1~~GAHX01002207.1.p2  ORF type:complete len:218 (-),score=26.21 GAHX01002207.1:128-781(-)
MKKYILSLIFVSLLNSEVHLSQRKHKTQSLRYVIPTTCQNIFTDAVVVLNNESLAPSLSTHPNLAWKRAWSLLQNYNALKITVEVAVDDTLTMRQFKVESNMSETEQFAMPFAPASIVYSEDLVAVPNQCIGTVDDLEAVDTIFYFSDFLEQPVPVLESCIKYRLVFKMHLTGALDGSGNEVVEAQIDLQPIDTCPSPVVFDPLFDLVVSGYLHSII